MRTMFRCTQTTHLLASSGGITHSVTKRRSVLQRGATIALAMGLASGSALLHGQTPPKDVIAYVGESAITRADVEAIASGQMFALRNQEYDMLRRAAEGAIDLRLVEIEAKKQGMTADELLAREVTSKVAPVTSAEAQAVYEAGPDKYAGMSAESALAQVTASLAQSRAAKLRTDYVRRLRAATAVKVVIQPPRTKMPEGKGRQTRGAASAPVVIAEFMDYQCPFCGQAAPAVKRLVEAYPDKVRYMPYNFVLAAHTDAPRAADAAVCAARQNRYWEMHDYLFDHQKDLSASAVSKAAADLGLNTAAFSECLSASSTREGTIKDMKEGKDLGVTSIPAFFINGRVVTGAVPYDALAKIVDEELAAAKAAPALP
jgi:protein-disulfide isomerase